MLCQQRRRIRVPELQDNISQVAQQVTEGLLAEEIAKAEEIEKEIAEIEEKLKSLQPKVDESHELGNRKRELVRKLHEIERMKAVIEAATSATVEGELPKKIRKELKRARSSGGACAA